MQSTAKVGVATPTRRQTRRSLVWGLRKQSPFAFGIDEMAEPAITADQIAEKALQPQSASSDGESVSQRPMSDLIAGAKFAAETAAAADPAAVLRSRMFQIKTPGGA